MRVLSLRRVAGVERMSVVRSATLVSLVVLLPIVFMGCGGTSGTQPGDDSIVNSPTLEQLRADCAALGKPFPAFLEETQPAMTTQALLPTLALGELSSLETVPQGRVSWFECSLTDVNHGTYVRTHSENGDADLFVFSPMRFSDGTSRLKLIGYDISPSKLNTVGPFFPRSWGGAGRFIAAVYGYATNNRCYVKFW
jgi:hypothetical protein